MNALLQKGAHARRFVGPIVITAVLVTLFAPGMLPAVNAPEVEIKKHSTGKEATIRQGDREWYIYIDVDDNRTMIIHTESVNGKETNNAPEVVDRPMSNAEVDRVITDWASGIKSTLKP